MARDIGYNRNSRRKSATCFCSSCVDKNSCFGSEITAGKNHVGSTGYVWLYNRETGDFNGLPILLGRASPFAENDG